MKKIVTNEGWMNVERATEYKISFINEDSVDGATWTKVMAVVSECHGQCARCSNPYTQFSRIHNVQTNYGVFHICEDCAEIIRKQLLLLPVPALALSA